MSLGRNTIVAWSRADLVRAILTMVKIAGWAFALAWAAYLFRFIIDLGPVGKFLFGDASATQITAAKAEWGHLGDFIGGVLNPLVSLLALVGLAFTLLLQHESMTRTQEDAKKGHEALAAQTLLAMDTARLQALAAALDVMSEMHRQAVAVSSANLADDYLGKKEGLATDILAINDRLKLTAASKSAA